jgi:hypothetical protein
MTSDLSNTTRRKDDAPSSSSAMVSMAGGIHKNNNTNTNDDENHHHENDGGNNENILFSGGGGEASSSSSSVSNAIRAAAANSSAQTRFSFYDAQEVHLQFASSGNPTLTSQEQQQKQQSAKNTKNSAGKMEAQRFTFYTTDLASSNNKNHDDDDEDGDQFYTPTAGRTVGLGLGSSSNPIKTHTPPHSNYTNNIASKDGPRGGGGIAVRTTTTSTSSRTSHKKRTSHNCAAREELAAVDNLPGLGAIDSSGSTDEILRSLQETEEQRLQLLKAVTPSEDIVRKLNQNGGKGSTTTNTSIKSNSTRRPMSVAATTLVQQGGSTTTGIKAANGLPSSLGATPSVDTAGGTSNDAAAHDSNPYEDAIKEALDLLRRHRSPTGGTPRDAAQNLPDAATGTGTGPLQLLSPRSRALRPRTPRENDRVLQSRLDDDDQIVEEVNVDGAMHMMGVGATSDPVASYEEAKLKAKQRQERMAGYASRLQEFKSSMPTEIGDTTTTTAWQPRPPTTSSINSLEGVHQPASTSGHTGTASGKQLQPQPQLGMSPIPQHGSMDEVISDVSQSTRLRDDEIQRGVERVLLAILERANNSRSRGSQGLSFSPNEQQQDAANATIKAQLSEEALIHAMEELLGQVASSDSLGGVKSEPPVAQAVGGPVSGSKTDLSTTHSSGGRGQHNEGGPPVATTTTTSTGASRGIITTKRSAEKSVVDELLAEEEEDDPEYLILQQCISPSSTAVLAASPMYSRNNWPGPREEKKLPDSSEVLQQRPNETSSSSKQDQQSCEDFSQIMDNCQESSKEEDDAVTADDDDETARQGDSVDCIDDDEHDETYTDAGDDEDGLIGSPPSDKEGSLERVLGPLSKRGTTGVVLDLHNSPETGQEEEEPPPVGESFSKVMKEAESVMSYVSSAMSPNLKAKQQLEQQEQKRPTVDEKYSAEDEDRPEDDEEAKELMRTLCAHLLPFGVDQSKQLVEIVPAWDETNPNEAGYRIIRLSKSQLRRVEGAFESMINSLKRDSERQLNKLELATINGYDATFVKELQEAEKLLDDEERRVSQVAAEQQQKQQQRFAGLLGLKKKPAEVKPLQPGALSLNDDDKESVTGEPTPCHPDFPGVKTAGQGEMGDLEYFHLPIIFKSHVTGFEPTKDLVLEPGNVVAGQYMVESELGTAAFSTAYRCIDLSSDSDNDVSGLLSMAWMS